MPIVVVVIQGLFELLGLAGFLAGYFAHIWWLMILGGCFALLDDVIEIGMGVLNPVFPLLLAIALAFVITPWYVGIFWASVVFKIIGIPISVRKICAPRRVLSQGLDDRGDT